MTYASLPEATTEADSPLMVRMRAEKKAARRFQARRHEDWNENYELYRNKVRINRLTQRQTVNIPLMKETVKTLLSKTDDPPSVDWKELGGDIAKEMIFQEIWNNDYDRLNFEGIDIQDKKTVLLYGRGFKKLNWVDGKMEVRALDIYDVLVDPMVDPLDLETARYLIHQNIFRSLRSILADKRYNADAKKKLETWISSDEGMLISAENRKAYEAKMERMQAMGLRSDEIPSLASGDMIISLTEHYTDEWLDKEQRYERRVVVYANDSIELLNEPLVDLMGVTFYPFVSWGEDVETQDFWSDAPADLVRVPNKVVNVWFSQLVENRTLKNFQMHWYDGTIQGYVPQTYEPGPGRMLPAPGDPNKTIMPVNISGLDDTILAINFIKQLIESGTAVTAIDKGVSENKETTLGEVQILVGKAMERTLAMAKFYRRSWQELAMKYYEILNANEGEKLTLYKTSRSGKIWPKVVYPTDWKSEKGFRATVRSSSEQEEEKTKGLQRMMFVLKENPDNAALKRILGKRQMELLDLSVEEIREIEDEEKKRADMMMQEAAMMQQPGMEQQPTLPGAPTGPQTPQVPNPEEERLMAGLEQRLGALGA